CEVRPDDYIMSAGMGVTYGDYTIVAGLYLTPTSNVFTGL
ncbi:MAG: hypothetical protein K0R94_975, partial [Burkholderiales bacterium]|nr:hypothetical protein [Burkholderiales bacterium]